MEYSYSFSEELQQEWEWPERYPTQPEIEVLAEGAAGDREAVALHQAGVQQHPNSRTLGSTTA